MLSVTDLKGGGSGSACTERSCNELNGRSDDDEDEDIDDDDDKDGDTNDDDIADDDNKLI